MGFFDVFRKKKVEDISNMKMDIGRDIDMGNLGASNHPDFADISASNNPSFGNQGYDMNPGSANLSGAVNLSTMNSMGSMSNAGYAAPQAGYSLEKDIQILSLKLDAIKSEIDSMNQRLKNIEMIAEKEQQSAIPQKRWY